MIFYLYGMLQGGEQKWKYIPSYYSKSVFSASTLFMEVWEPSHYSKILLHTKKYGLVSSLFDNEQHFIPGQRRIAMQDLEWDKLCVLEWRGYDYLLLIKGKAPIVVTGSDTLVFTQGRREIARMEDVPGASVVDSDPNFRIDAVKRLKIEPDYLPELELIASAAVMRFAPVFQLPAFDGVMISDPAFRPKTGLIYTPLTKKAMQLCFEAHKDQVDKSGLPYVFHPFHLAEQMESEDTILVALLHDVVEDTHYTLDDLAQMGFPPQVTEALALMTHDEAVPYLDYVAAIKENPIARIVKLADLRHNSDLTRLDAVDDKVRERMSKYAQAIELLEAPSADGYPGLFEACFRRSEHQELIRRSHLPFRDGYYVTEYDKVIMVRGELLYSLGPDGWLRNDRIRELWYDSMADFADIPADLVAQLGLARHPIRVG